MQVYIMVQSRSRLSPGLVTTMVRLFRPTNFVYRAVHLIYKYTFCDGTMIMTGIDCKKYGCI